MSPIKPKHPSVGNVPSGMVLFAKIFQVCLDLRFMLDGKAIAKMLGSLDLEQAFTRRTKREIGVCHGRHLPLEADRQNEAPRSQEIQWAG